MEPNPRRHTGGVPPAASLLSNREIQVAPSSQNTNPLIINALPPDDAPFTSQNEDENQVSKVQHTQ